MRRQFRRTTIITFGLLSLLVGLLLARRGVNFSAKLAALAISGGLVFAARRKTLGLVGLVLFGLLLGLWRGAAFNQKLVPLTKMYDSKVRLMAMATTDAIYGKHSQISFDISKLEFIEPEQVNIPGFVKVSGFGVNMVHRGDLVEVSGKLHKINGSSNGAISFAKLSLLAQNHSWLERTRRRFLAGIQNALPEPAASFGTGLLIGLRSTIPKDTTSQLSRVGLSHVVAVSGYNLTIIVVVIMRLMRNRSKYQSTLVALAMIGLFLLFTGLSSSIVRAAVVSVLSIWAWYYGRRFKPVLLIALAAAITAAWNPIYIWTDVGWYLSFAAFFGVMVVGPLILKKIRPKKPPGILTAVLTETLAAQLMAAPIIMYTFHEFSLVALPANILVVPFVSLAMLLTLVAGLAGMLAPAVAGWFAWPAKWLLTYMLSVVSLFSKIPKALAASSISFLGLVLIYVLILVTTVLLARRFKIKYGTITDRNNLNLW